MVETDYQLHKKRAAERSAEESKTGRDIGEIPPVGNPERLSRAEESFQAFCESYFPAKFSLGWSNDHLKVIQKIEGSVDRSEHFAVAMPRGSGKTTLCECAVLWALLTGRHDFVMLIGSSERNAFQMLTNLKTDLASNELLLEDFPATCYPIRCLEGETRRCTGQHHQGEPTLIGWDKRQLKLPTIRGSQASGGLVRVAGITGNIRGAKHTRPDGGAIRPTMAIIDDPQTDESARSVSQSEARLSTINGAVAALAGPGKRTGIMVPCTVIEEGDLADQLLDRDQNPQWRGERFKLLYQMPVKRKLWDRYFEMRIQEMREDAGTERSDRFYQDNRKAMDEGAIAAWPDRKLPDEISAIQHAMNLLLLDEAAFWSEYQNEPFSEQHKSIAVSAKHMVERINSRPQGEVPKSAPYVTAFIDVQERILFYVVTAWEPDGTGHVLDYGTHPDQKRRAFTLRDVKRTLRRSYQGSGVEGSIQSGLTDLGNRLLGRQWPVAGADAGQTLRIDRLLIDSGYLPQVVGAACRQLGATAMPSKGVGIKAGQRPMTAYRRKPGERHGHNWYIPSVARTAEVRHVLYDANYWKTHIHRGLATTPGDPGALTLWGTSTTAHRMLADHVCSAEVCNHTEGQGRELYEWEIRPSKPDNHYFDCLVGTAVAGSMSGAGPQDQKARKPKSMTLSKMRKAA